VNVGVVGDYRDGNETHSATTAALHHAAGALGVECKVTWLGTAGLERHDVATVLAGFDALVIAPGSPYASFAGALAAIRYAREHRVPVLGTCGGFQHMVIEYARDVAGIVDATHAETDPDASRIVVSALTCSLAGQTFAVTLVDGTAAYRAYGRLDAVERYYCSFGLNLDYLPALTAAGLVVSGTDADGEPRIVEVPAHPWFVATLFVPQTASTEGAPHPLLVGLVGAAAGARAAIT
jgi:CTP synthase (UTP-ammonia lyase)